MTLLVSRDFSYLLISYCFLPPHHPPCPTSLGHKHSEDKDFVRLGHHYYLPGTETCAGHMVYLNKLCARLSLDRLEPRAALQSPPVLHGVFAPRWLGLVPEAVWHDGKQRDSGAETARFDTWLHLLAP